MLCRPRLAARFCHALLTFCCGRTLVANTGTTNITETTPFSQTTANYKPMDLKWYLHHLLQIEVDLHSFLPSCPAYLYSLSRPSAFSLRFVHLGWKCALHFMNCRADCRVHFDIIFIYIYIYIFTALTVFLSASLFFSSTPVRSLSAWACCVRHKLWVVR